MNKVYCIVCSNGLPGKLERGSCPRQENGYDCGMYVLGELTGMADLSNRDACDFLPWRHGVQSIEGVVYNHQTCTSFSNVAH